MPDSQRYPVIIFLMKNENSLVFILKFIVSYVSLRATYRLFAAEKKNVFYRYFNFKMK